MGKKINIKKLLFHILAALLIYGTNYLMLYKETYLYERMNHPFLAFTPSTYFLIRLCLFILLGIASYCINQSSDHMRSSSLSMYATMLLTALLWPTVFFFFSEYFLSFLILLLLWLMALLTFSSFFAISKLAGILCFPYAIWLTYLLYINIGMCIMNFY